MMQILQQVSLSYVFALVMLANVAWHIAVVVLLYRIWKTLERQQSSGLR